MTEHVASKLASLRELLATEPQRAMSQDSAAVASLGPNLTCEVSGPGEAVVRTAMPPGMGGDGSGFSPGWYMRCAIASCAATTIALHAAEAGINLEDLEVRVDSTSDSRGILGAADVRPGMLDARMTISATAPGVSTEELERIIRRADLGSPVGESVRNGVTVTTTVVTDRDSASR